jgi:outer membrane protein assembly factor BamB
LRGCKTNPSLGPSYTTQAIVKNYDSNTRHNVAGVFYTYGLSTGLVWNGSTYLNGPIFAPSATYVFGLPITDPYWTKAVVGGVEKDVLVQLFERRALTYTPTNSPANRVEMGNVGQHYYRWRYLENIGLGSGPITTPVPGGQPYGNYSQARAPYLKSGPIPQGGESNVTHFLAAPNAPYDYKIISSPVYDPDKKLVIIGTNGSDGLVAVDLTDFKAPIQRWHFSPPSAFNGPIALYQGIVYAGSYNGIVYALNEETGTVRWQSAASNDGYIHYVNYALAFDANTVYFVKEGGFLYGVGLSDGSTKIVVKPGEVNLVTSPVIGDDGTIYVGGGDHKIYAFDSSGRQLPANRWVTSLLDANIGAYSLAFGNGRLYAGSNFGTLYAFNSDGTIQKQKHFSDGKGVGTTPAVVNLNGVKRVYVGTDDGTVYGVNADNIAEIQWQFSLASQPIIKSSPAVVDGYVYFGADDKKVYRVDGLKAENYVALTSANDIFGYNSAVVNSGYLIIASKDGILHLIK